MSVTRELEVFEDRGDGNYYVVEKHTRDDTGFSVYVRGVRQTTLSEAQTVLAARDTDALFLAHDREKIALHVMGGGLISDYLWINTAQSMEDLKQEMFNTYYHHSDDLFHDAVRLAVIQLTDAECTQFGADLGLTSAEAIAIKTQASNG